MDPSLYTPVKWYSRKKESHFDGYSAVYIVVHWSLNIFLGIYPRDCHIYIKQDAFKIYCKHTIWDIEGKEAYIWGCPAYVKNIFGCKLSARSDKYRFVGYTKETNGYYFYHPTKQKIFVSRHVIFLKNKFIQEGGSGRNI